MRVVRSWSDLNCRKYSIGSYSCKVKSKELENVMGIFKEGLGVEIYIFEKITDYLLE
jgi:hypothetical protein